MEIPFMNLRAMHEEVRAEIEAGWRDLIDRSAFIGGAPVEAFEAAFATYCGAAHCVGLGSGTDAVRLALQAVGVRAGEVVVTVPHTFIATVEGVTQAGAVPAFVDIEATSYTMDPARVAAYLAGCQVRNGHLVDPRTGGRVTCLLPVHLYGQPADMDGLKELADRYELRLVEDAAQAHGAEYKGRRCGGLADAAAFSFYPGKNLGAMGEAGAVTTNDAGVAEQCRILRDHGQRERYVHVRADGGNARLDAVQAVVLNAKLPHLDRWTDARRRVARWYDTQLRNLDIEPPREMPYAHHVYHLYVVLVHDPTAFRSVLDRSGVGTGLHYPVPLHLQDAYAGLNLLAGNYPASEGVAARCVSLPMFPHLSEPDVQLVTSAVGQALHAARSQRDRGAGA